MNISSFHIIILIINTIYIAIYIIEIIDSGAQQVLNSVKATWKNNEDIFQYLRIEYSQFQNKCYQT